MKKRHNTRWLGPVLCVALLAAASIAVKVELDRRDEANSRSMLVDAGPGETEAGQAVRITVRGEDDCLLSEQLAVSSGGRLLIRMTGETFREAADASAVLVDRDSGEPLAEPNAVELTEYTGLVPEDIYRPGKLSKETLTYHLQTVPVYQGREPSALGQGDFQWSEDYPERLTYTGREYSTEFGIDVSAHQNRASRNGKIDWQAVAADGVDFVMVRAGFRGTETGALREDQYFRENLHGAREAGLDTGIYFFSQAVTIEEALEEADFVLDLLKQERITGPVAFDWEVDDPRYRVHGTAPEMATACAIAFCRRIAEAGFTPMVYASRQVNYLLYDQGALAPYLSWYPEYEDRSSAQLYPDYYYAVDYWQFSDSCTVDGIGGRVDGNLHFYLD